jgi:hypothetical protein
VGDSLGSSFDAISVSTKALKHMEFDRLKCTPMVMSKSGTYPINDDEEEADTISDGQLLTHLIGEVSEVRLDDAVLDSCYELQTTHRKSRASSLKKYSWPNKKARVTKSSIVSK